MSQGFDRSMGNDGRREISVKIPGELASQLESFCREKKVAADRVVERALIEYFREGEMSH